MRYKTQTDTVRVYKNMPAGWEVSTGASTQPAGTVWIRNGQPRWKKDKDGKIRYNKAYKTALLVKDEQYMIDSIAQKRRLKQDNRFLADKTTEAKIQSAMRRQKQEQDKITKEKAKAVNYASQKPAKKPSCTKKKR